MNQGFAEYQDARQRADFYAQTGQKEEAIEEFTRAIELLPNSGMSAQQQSIILPILERRLKRVRES